jgi:hypothetical protein
MDYIIVTANQLVLLFLCTSVHKKPKAQSITFLKSLISRQSAMLSIPMEISFRVTNFVAINDNPQQT